MSDERPDIELSRAEYRARRVFDGPLANARQLRIAFAGFFLAAMAGAAVCAWLQQWWMPFCIIPIAMWAGASLAGLWPNWFFGSDASKDDDFI